LQNVQTLAQRIARYELQLAAEREDDAPLPHQKNGRHSHLGGNNSMEEFNQMMERMKEDDLQAEI
jgi:hypothetical protein